MASTPELSAVRPVPDEQAYLLLERVRWGGHPHTCPHCAATDRTYLLTPLNGGDRRTRTGSPTARRVWKCGACRRQFSVLTGTVLQGTRVPLPAWITAVRLLADPSGGRVSATDVRRATGLGQEAARHVIARWRAASPLTAAVGTFDDASALAAAPEARTERALAALLAITAADAAAVRERSPARRRPVGRYGPVLDLGDPDGADPDGVDPDGVDPHDPVDGSGQDGPPRY